jgi:hypothetical protein
VDGAGGQKGTAFVVRAGPLLPPSEDQCGSSETIGSGCARGLMTSGEMCAAAWPSLKNQPPMLLFFLAPEYQLKVKHTKTQRQDKKTAHMNGELSNAQEPTCGQFCLVTISGSKAMKVERDKEKSAIWDWTRGITDHSRIDEFRKRFLSR